MTTVNAGQEGKAQEPARTGERDTRGRSRGGTLTGAGGPGPSASPPLLSLEEPGLRRGPGEAAGPTPQSPVGLGLCTG